jgi:hypothetical protein
MNKTPETFYGNLTLQILAIVFLSPALRPWGKHRHSCITSVTLLKSGGPRHSKINIIAL